MCLHSYLIISISSRHYRFVKNLEIGRVISLFWTVFMYNFLLNKRFDFDFDLNYKFDIEMSFFMMWYSSSTQKNQKNMKKHFKNIISNANNVQISRTTFHLCNKKSIAQRSPLLKSCSPFLKGCKLSVLIFKFSRVFTFMNHCNIPLSLANK